MRDEEKAGEKPAISGEPAMQGERRPSREMEQRQVISIFDSIDEAIYVSDPHSYEILYVNRALKKALGRDPTGGLCYEEFQGLEQPCDFCTNPLLFANPEEPYTWEYHNRFLDRDYLIVDRLIRWPDGRSVRFEFALDITERKRTEEELRDSEELHRTLVGISPDAVTVTDLDGRIAYVSPQTLSMHGYDEEKELLGKDASVFIDPALQEKAATMWRKTLEEGEIRNVEFTAVRKNGERFVAELNAAVIRDSQGKAKNVVAFTRDISERKMMEKELRVRNEELEAFAHTISHDLLTPVAIVEGYAKAALEADAEGRTEAEQECLEAIVRGARRMSDLINSLLQYAQAGHLDAESYGVDPEEVFREVLLDFKDDLQRKEIQVEVEPELPRIAVDGVKLRQVFCNLVSNAVKHMGDNPLPSLRLSATSRGATATFCVRDNGMGIPAELHDKIFEPFRHFTLAEAPGLGIGLSTVKRAVKAWGGRVWVESKPGEGAAFFFTAPVADQVSTT